MCILPSVGPAPGHAPAGSSGRPALAPARSEVSAPSAPAFHMRTAAGSAPAAASPPSPRRLASLVAERREKRNPGSDWRFSAPVWRETRLQLPVYVPPYSSHCRELAQKRVRHGYQMYLMRLGCLESKTLLGHLPSVIGTALSAILGYCLVIIAFAGIGNGVKSF